MKIYDFFTLMSHFKLLAVLMLISRISVDTSDVLKECQESIECSLEDAKSLTLFINSTWNCKIIIKVSICLLFYYIYLWNINDQWKRWIYCFILLQINGKNVYFKTL